MRAALVLAAVLWPATLAAALVDRLDDSPRLAGTAVYVAASRLCHQRPDRSFHTHGHQWPVCARCAGLYAGGLAGALVAAVGARGAKRARVLGMLAVAAIPTAVTWSLEAAGLAAVSGGVRMAAAVPLGAALAGALVWIATPGIQPGEPDRID